MLNKIMLIGNLGKDPEMNYTPGGLAITKFSLAVSRNKKTSTGERQEETDWFNIVAMDKRAKKTGRRPTPRTARGRARRAHFSPQNLPVLPRSCTRNRL